jgi:hypothetical protein
VRWRSWARENLGRGQAALAAESLHQLIGLGAQAFCGGGALLHQRRVLLGGVVHLRHRLADRAHAAALLLRGDADLAHDVGHPANGVHHFGHRGAGLVHQVAALFNTLHTGGDQALDLFGRFG